MFKRLKQLIANNIITAAIFVLFTPAFVWSLSTYMPVQGGTGTNATPQEGQVLVGTSDGKYTPTTTVPNINATNVTTTNLTVTNCVGCGGSGSGSVGTSTQNYVAIYQTPTTTTGTPYLIVNNDKVGINSSSPNAQLSVEATGGTNGIVYASSSAIFLAQPNGQVAVGTYNPTYYLSTLLVKPNFLVSGDESTRIAVRSYSANTTRLATVDFIRFGGTEASSTPIEANSAIGTFSAYGGSTATSTRLSSQIRFEIDGTPNDSASDMPGRITFQTTPDGSATIQERMRITNGGLVGVGSSTPIAQLSVQASAGTIPFAIASSTGNLQMYMGKTGNVSIGVPAGVPTNNAKLVVRGDGGDLYAIENSAGVRMLTLAENGLATYGGSIRVNGGQVYSGSASNALLYTLTAGTSWVALANSTDRKGFVVAGPSTGVMAQNYFEVRDRWNATGNESFVVNASRYVGINTSSPYARLSVKASSTDSNILAITDYTNQSLLNLNSSGQLTIGTTTKQFALNIGAGGDIYADGGQFDFDAFHGPGNLLTVSGSGIKMLWYSRKAAFRAGLVDGDQWDEGNIGLGSAAFGYNAKASGDLAFAAGDNVTSTGNSSVAFGRNTTASGDNSLAHGDSSIASAQSTFAMGYRVSSTAQYSFAHGYQVAAKNTSTYAFGRNLQVTGEQSVGFNLCNDFNSLEVTATSTFAVLCGKMAINTTTPRSGYQLTVNGSIYATGLELAAGEGSVAATTTLPATDPRSIFVQGRIMYVVASTSYPGTLQAFDITDTKPKLLSTVTTTDVSYPEKPKALFVSGPYAYIANSLGNFLSIYDVSNPSNMTWVSSTTLPYQPWNMAVSGKYAYITSFGSQKLMVVDIGNPLAPVVVASSTTDVGANNIAVRDGFVYLTNYTSNTLQIFDVTDPTSPSLLSTTDLSVTGDTFPTDVAVQDRFAYVTFETTSTVAIFDVSNPSAISLTGSVNVASGGFGNPVQIVVDGKYARVINRSNPSIVTIDISSSTAPTIQSTLFLSSDAPASFAVRGKYAYLAANAFGGSPSIMTVDLGGVVFADMEVGNMEVGSVFVRNRLTALDAFFQAGLQVGRSMMVGGDLVVSGNGVFHGNLGVGTSTPKSKLSVDNGDVYINTSTRGYIMTSPNGSCFRLGASDAGVLSANSITCP